MPIPGGSSSAPVVEPTVVTAGTARLADDTGSTLITLTSADVATDPIAVESWDLGFPEVRAVADADPAADGEIDATTHVGARGITAQMTVVGDDTDTAGVWYRRLRALCHPRRRYWLHMQRDGWAAERRIQVRPDSLTDPIDSTAAVLLTVQASWRAPYGLWQSITDDTVTLAPSGATEPGFTFPVHFPYTFGTGVASGATTVTVDDESEPTLPTIDIYGPCVNPVVSNLTAGTQFAFTSLILTAGQFVRITFRDRTVLLDGSAASSRYGDVDWTVSTWWTLQPGVNQLAFTPTAPTAGCQARVSWPSLWI